MKNYSPIIKNQIPSNHYIRIKVWCPCVFVFLYFSCALRTLYICHLVLQIFFYPWHSFVFLRSQFKHNYHLRMVWGGDPRD